MKVLDLDISLQHHLFSNHYPPLPRGSVAIAKRAIEHAHRCEGFDLFSKTPCTHRISIKDIGTHRRYGTRVPVPEIIEAWHLDFYLEDLYECDDCGRADGSHDMDVEH
jgi:hypothetical protein